MEALATPRLSRLAGLLLRRPPSLREMATLIGYADDYAWFTGMVHRLFPQEAGTVLAAPDLRLRVEGFAQLFGERHFPLYVPYADFRGGGWGRPALDMAAQGHPLRPAGLRLR